MLLLSQWGSRPQRRHQFAVSSTAGAVSATRRGRVLTVITTIVAIAPSATIVSKIRAQSGMTAAESSDPDPSAGAGSGAPLGARGGGRSERGLARGYVESIRGAGRGKRRRDVEHSPFGYVGPIGVEHGQARRLPGGTRPRARSRRRSSPHSRPTCPPEGKAIHGTLIDVLPCESERHDGALWIRGSAITLTEVVTSAGVTVTVKGSETTSTPVRLIPWMSTTNL